MGYAGESNTQKSVARVAPGALGACFCCEEPATHELKLLVLCAWCYERSCDSYHPAVSDKQAANTRERTSCKRGV